MTTFCFAQTNEISKTRKYAGIYSFGKNAEKTPVGRITIYPETDSTILFFIDVTVGAPSYNLAQMYDRLKIYNGRAILNSNEYGDKGCKWQLTFLNKEIAINTLDNSYDCGFGANVTIDNIYKQKDNSIPQYFIDGHGHKIFFAKTSPENYLK